MCSRFGSPNKSWLRTKRRPVAGDNDGEPLCHGVSRLYGRGNRLKRLRLLLLYTFIKLAADIALGAPAIGGTVFILATEFQFPIFKCTSISIYSAVAWAMRMLHCRLRQQSDRCDSGLFNSCYFICRCHRDQRALRGQLTCSFRADGTWTAPTHARSRTLTGHAFEHRWELNRQIGKLNEVFQKWFSEMNEQCARHCLSATDDRPRASVCLVGRLFSVILDCYYLFYRCLFFCTPSSRSCVRCFASCKNAELSICMAEAHVRYKYRCNISERK